MLNREQLKQIIVEQRKTILQKNFGIERNQLKIFNEKKKTPHIIVITGLRRVGKSTFLRQIIKTHYSDKSFYYINFEDERLFNFNAKNFNSIYEAMIELYGKEKTFFIDEIQNVKNFETFVRRFYEQGFKFIITGSNANLLSREIGTKLTGRYLSISIKPFSFDEFLKIKKITLTNEMFYETESIAKLKKYFDKYLYKGGMPEYLLYNDAEILTRIYEDIVIKDIAVRYKIDNLLIMRELYQYLITNFTNKFSYTSLKKLFHFGSVHTVKKYIYFLEESFFISVINKFDYSIKKQIINEKKIYVIDNGFIPLISSRINKDSGWLLENFVFNRISNIGKIFYYNNKGECDFIVQNKKKIVLAIQVCWELNNEIREREIKGLINALKEFKLKEGLIITSNQEEDIAIDNFNILIRPAWKWVLKEN